MIYSSSWDEHFQQFKTVFKRLCDANLTLNLAKCEFGRATVEFLGKVVGQRQVKPVNSKVEAIRSFPAPGSRRELRRFLGMAGYYRCFCNNVSAVAAPLTDLLSPVLRLTVRLNWLLIPVKQGRGLSCSRMGMMMWNILSLTSLRSLICITMCIENWHHNWEGGYRTCFWSQAFWSLRRLCKRVRCYLYWSHPPPVYKSNAEYKS